MENFGSFVKVLENSIITRPSSCAFTFIFIVPSKTQNWHGCASAISPSTSNWFSPAKQQENEYGHGKVCTRYFCVYGPFSRKCKYLRLPNMSSLTLKEPSWFSILKSMEGLSLNLKLMYRLFPYPINTDQKPL